MRFNQESDPQKYAIRAYSEGYVDVQIPTIIAAKDNSEKSIRVQQSFIMSPQKLIQNWPLRTASALTNPIFDQILDLKPEIILLGTGLRLEFADISITKTALENGIGVETMDSAAACRTYNILMLEGRNVAVALMLE